MFVYELARKANRYIKQQKKRRAGYVVSPVRRIERVFPVPGGRVCAMTFDDGPTRAQGLTRSLVASLAEAGASATFDIIGSTAENYPDTAGEPRTFYWGGERYDHYPDFGCDGEAGAEACPELVELLLNNGCELANHGYRHLIFGKSRVYSKRVPFSSYEEALADGERLQKLAMERFGCKITLARPPHYVDNLTAGRTAYDLYDALGCNYLASSFDGGGWLPRESLSAEVRAMTEPLRAALEADPDCLNGQIIFQKDGCSMSRLFPVAEALPVQLELLKKHGYSVRTVSGLLALSPCEDCPPDDDAVRAAAALAARGLPVFYKNNTLHPERVFTFGELCALLCPAETRRAGVAARAWAAAVRKKSAAAPAAGDDVRALCALAGFTCDYFPQKTEASRREALCALAEHLQRSV